jgi:class 3 adenylate cyclase
MADFGEVPLTVDDLKGIPLLRDVPTALLEQIVPTLHVRHFSDRTHLFREGEVSSDVFVIIDGHVDVEVDGTFLVPRNAFEVVGEQALLGDGVRTATVTAKGFARALVLPAKTVRPLLRDEAFAGNFLRTLSTKLSQATRERAIRYSKEELVFGEFRAHVAPQVLARLLDEGEKYGAPRDVNAVVLFSDIRGFTLRSAAVAPQDLARDLSRYFNHVVEVIHRHAGMVDKFVGDAVMGVWGGFGPEDALDPQRAFDCACEMVKTAGQFSLGGAPIAIGVGLEAGKVFMGNVGGEGKRQFTVLGSVVNMAARYEAKSKSLEPIILGAEIRKRLPEGVAIAFCAHEGLEIEGAGRRTVYGFDPRARVTQEE